MNIEELPDPTPPGEQNNDLTKNDPDTTPQRPEQSTQQGSSLTSLLHWAFEQLRAYQPGQPTQQGSSIVANESGESNDPLSKETREQQRQKLNATIAQYADLQGKKGVKQSEIEAELKQLFEQIKQNNNGPSGKEPSMGTILSEVETQQIDWLWQGRIPLGKITILDGDPGMGKSLLAINIAACVSTGRPMPDGTPGIQGGIILIAPEDSAEDTIKPRIEAVGGNPSRVLLLNTIDIFDENLMGIFERPFSLSRDMKDLEWIIQYRKAKLVVLDPLMAVLGRNINSSSDQSVREVLIPLRQLAERTGCAILIIRHLNKGSSSNPLYRGAGSIGIIGSVRVGLIVVRDPADEQTCILATYKNNLSKYASHLTYQIVENEHGIPYIQWLGEAYHTVSNLLSPPSNLSFVRQEILRVLKQAGKPLEVKEIAERTGQKTESLRMTLIRMYEAGEIARPYRGKYSSLDYVTITEISENTSDDTSDASVTSVINVINVANDEKPDNDLPTSEE